MTPETAAVAVSSFNFAKHRAEAAEAENVRLARQVADLEAALDAAMHELERADDVRANRTRILGNTHMILAAARSRDPQAQPSADREEPQTCPKCGNELHAYRGPLCRYCTPGEFWE